MSLVIPRTEGMTDAEKNAAWDAYFELRRVEAQRILAPTREEVGYPTDPHDPDAWFGTDPEVMHRYIEALENRIVAEASVRAMMRL